MIYVLTREVNEYDQQGEYFVHAWDHEPTPTEIVEISQEINSHIDYKHVVVGGGGRLDFEYEWFYLRKVE